MIRHLICEIDNILFVVFFQSSQEMNFLVSVFFFYVSWKLRKTRKRCLFVSNLQQLYTDGNNNFSVQVKFNQRWMETNLIR